ncbi:MAG: FxsA family protein [Candidatus Nanosalina sp.]
MLGLFIIALLILPFVDFYILVQVAGKIGFWNTLGIILLTGVAGAEIVRREGRYVLRKIQSSVTAGEMSRNALEIGLLVLGGLLLIIPGLITDGLGFLMIVRPVRERIAARLGNGENSNVHVEVETFRL